METSKILLLTIFHSSETLISNNYFGIKMKGNFLSRIYSLLIFLKSKIKINNSSIASLEVFATNPLTAKSNYVFPLETVNSLR